MENYASLLDTRFRFAYDLNRLAMHSGNPDFPDPNVWPASKDHTMSEQANGVPVGPQVAYAVIAGGVITPESDIVTLTNVHGAKCPIIVAIFDDMGKADKYKSRLNGKLRRLLSFDRDDLVKATPIYGVVKVQVQGKRAGGAKKGRTMTDEQKKKMQAGRRAAQAAAGK